MKVHELAKEMGIKSKVLIGMLDALGFKDITHNMHTVNELALDLLKKNKGTTVSGKPIIEDLTPSANTRRLFGINLNKLFSVVEFAYSGGNFNDKLSAVAKELNVEAIDLLESLKKNGYPVLQNEYTDDITYKSHAVIEYRKCVAKSDILKPEDL
jgi:hypothetical protein